MMMNEVNKAAEIIRNGGNILCPTDTIWGISAAANNEAAVDQVFQIKNRPANKSMIVLVADLKMLQNYVDEISAQAIHLIEKSKRPTSIIYPKGKNLAKNVLAANGSVAIRIVEDDFCKALIQELGEAIISTSANLSGAPNPTIFNEVSTEIKDKVDYVVNWKINDTTKNKASEIYLVEGSNVTKIR